MGDLRIRQAGAMVLLGLLGWALCGAIMFVGMAVSSIEATPIVHAVGAPLIFAIIAWIYFRRWNDAGPLSTAVAFVAIVVFMDVFLVAMVINRSFEMFTNPLGTCIPFALIFIASYLTGLRMRARAHSASATPPLK